MNSNLDRLEFKDGQQGIGKNRGKYSNLDRLEFKVDIPIFRYKSEDVFEFRQIGI